MSDREFILTLSCPDRRGIVLAVARAIADGGGNILDSQQFGDPDASVFFMRVHFADEAAGDIDAWRATFGDLSADGAWRWELHDARHRQRMLIAVSREGHCVNDLLYRWQSGAIAAEVVGVVSTSRDFEALAAGYGVSHFVLPDGAAGPEARDNAILELVAEHNVERGRTRSIHAASSEREHAPSSPVAPSTSTTRSCPRSRARGPYAQAHQRGVKLIGATAHYVTEVLDEGPIIEQEVARVDHAHSVAELARVGRDVECVALARAVRWHLEHRVLLHGDRTVVFR